jgi:outer membrane protein OmpA-like peptidoglycan-associated protein
LKLHKIYQALCVLLKTSSQTFRFNFKIDALIPLRKVGNVVSYRCSWLFFVPVLFLCHGCLTPCEREEFYAKAAAPAPEVVAPEPKPEPEPAPAPEVSPPASPSAREQVFQYLTQEYKAVPHEKGLRFRIPTDPIFPPSRTEITPESRPRLEELGNQLAKLDSMLVRVEAYTDSSGQKAKNLQLSQLRAARFRELLTDSGVKQVQAKGFGDARSLADNATPEGRKLNRRFEVYLEETKAAASSATAEEKAMQALAAEYKGELTPEGLHFRLLTDPIFPPSQTEFNADAMPQLERLAAALAPLQNKLVRVEAYTDSSGQKTKNLEISRRRAERLLDFLKKSGVQNVQAAGLGDVKPVADNKTVEGRRNNRRFEIHVEDGK